MPSSTALLFFAVKEEARFFNAPSPSPFRIETHVTGMGRRNADACARRALDQISPQLVFTCGFAGGLHPNIQPGAIVFDADDTFPRTAMIAAAGGLAIRFHCADRVAVNSTEKELLRQTTFADAVEMESGIIRKICKERKIPSATLRVISDASWEDLPLDFNSLLTSDYKLDFRKLTLALVRSPSRISRLIALQRRTRFAAMRLAECLHTVLSEGAV